MIFICSTNDSRCQQMTFIYKCFLYSADDFYIQQEIYVSSNLEFAFTSMTLIFNNLRFAFS